MTRLLQQTIDRLQGLESLPEATQQQIAKQVLAVLDQFEAPSSSVPRQETVRAMDAWRRRRKRITLGDDLTLRELINEGRR